MTTADEKNMKSRKCGKFILTCVVLLGWLKKHVERSISREIYGDASMSRENVYCIFVIVTAIVSAPHSPVTIKAATNFSDSE